MFEKIRGAFGFSNQQPEVLPQIQPSPAQAAQQALARKKAEILKQQQELKARAERTAKELAEARENRERTIRGLNDLRNCMSALQATQHLVKAHEEELAAFRREEDQFYADILSEIELLGYEQPSAVSAPQPACAPPPPPAPLPVTQAEVSVQPTPVQPTPVQLVLEEVTEQLTPEQRAEYEAVEPQITRPPVEIDLSNLPDLA